MKGAYCKPRPSADGATLDIEVMPQVGFSLSSDGPFDWFLLDQIPPKEDMHARGYPRGSTVFTRIWGTAFEDASAALTSRGYPTGGYLGETPAPAGPVRAEFVFLLAQPEFRAVTKIAFNYLAHVMGSGFALDPLFSEARAYVTGGHAPKDRIVSLARPIHVERVSTQRPVRGHFLAVERRGNFILAQVSLLCRVRYVVVLSKGPFLVHFPLRKCHLFDCDARQVAEHDPPEL